MPRAKKQAEPAATYRQSYQQNTPIVRGVKKTIGKTTVAVDKPTGSHGTNLVVETAIKGEQHPRVRQKPSKLNAKPMTNMNHVIDSPSRPSDFGDVIAANDQDLEDRGIY